MTTASPAPTPVGAPGWLAETTALIAKRDALEPSSVEAADEFVDLQDELAARVPVLVAALEAVLALHSEFKIYEECGHEHTDDEVRAGTAVDASEFLSCADGCAYSVCRACCTGGWSQTEACASDHDALNCWPCPTREAIESALRDVQGGQS